MCCRYPLFAVLVLFLAGAGRAEPPKQVAAGKAGVLYRFGPQRVLVVRGTPREMGLAHGKLLAKEVRENVRAFLDEWAIGRMGRTRAELEAIWTQAAPHIPKRYHEELKGIAEGSGVPLADIQLIHALPSRYHCTGAAALPAVTADGKVYHTRSLDYALDIGDTVRPQTNALLHIAVPKDGEAHAIVGWAGFIGCVTGMNLAGVSVGEMGSRSKDETYDGVPMIFLLREVLWRARTLDHAKDIWRKGPRTCGYNFIFCDPDEICAVECNRSRIRFFGPGDEGENVGPHKALDGFVRRCNHFIDPELAKTQRKRYDPRKKNGSSFGAYKQQGDFLAARRGKIDGATMVELLRTYPASHPCLHQAVMCPNDRVMWVAHALDPATVPLAGAQNQPFYRYDLRGFVKGTPAPATVVGKLAEASERPISGGHVDGERAVEGVFAHEPARFAYTMQLKQRLTSGTVHAVTFPSPGPSKYTENLTVHAEYYRPAGKGPFPTTIVLHILDGRFYVARLIAASLAHRGVAALFIKLPYYGERRPEGDIDVKTLDLPDVVGAVQQAVRDVRRGAAWLRTRDDVQKNKIGIVGVSLGSFVAQLAAGVDGGFDRCAFVLGGGSITDTVYAGSKDTRKIVKVLEERGWPEAKVRPLFASIEPLKHTKGIVPKGVLMINCKADEVVPPASTRKFWKAVGKPTIHWYEGGHYAIKNHVFEVLGRILNHFDR